MSSRNIRRLVAEKEQKERDKNKEEKENEEPAEEFSPHFVQMNPAYEGLEVSSSSESELSALSDLALQDEAAAVIPEEDKYGAKKKTYTNTENENKKKKRKNKKKSSKKPDDMDEIDWSLQEVNRILGSPAKLAEEVTVDVKALWEKKIFSIHPNQINVNYELAKVFGDEERLRKVRKGTRRMRHEIGLSPDVHPFKAKGLSMTLYKTEGDIKFFKFEHTHDYKTRCGALVEQLKNMLFGQVRHENNLHSENCVEALLENCDFLYYVEEHKGANQALEQAIYCMQSVGEPSFNFVDGKTRLEYEYVENRPFHVAVLKYLHVLTNIACHRTALELAKVLLVLDPTDPLAVIFIIDTLAIRAREHQWLLDLIEFWREKRQAQRLFHMRYSRALAMFHVACKNKDYDQVEDSKYALMKAVKYFPLVAVKIMEFSKMAIPDEIKHNRIFIPPPNVAVSYDLNELMTLYAWLIGPRWREPQVWSWFIDTLTDLTDHYDRNPIIREEVYLNARLRAQLYRRLPTQMKRHLYAIRPMAKYISDGRMPHTNPSVSFNPFPLEGSNIDTYNYFTEWVQQYSPPENAFMAILRDIYPEMYQIGRASMGTMLEQMVGMEIMCSYGSYIVVGPGFHQPEEPRTYRVVFVRRRIPTAHEIYEPEPGGLRNGEGQGEIHNGEGQGGIHNGEGQGGIHNGEGQGGIHNEEGQGGIHNGEGQGGIHNGDGQGGIHNGEGHGGIHNGERHDGIHNGEGHGGIHNGEGQGGIHNGEGHGGIHNGEGHGGIHNGERYGGIHNGEGHGEIHNGEGHGRNHNGERHGGIHNGERHGRIRNGEGYGGIYNGERHGGIHNGEGHGGIHYGEGHGGIHYGEGHGGMHYREGHGEIHYGEGHGEIHYGAEHDEIEYGEGHGEIEYGEGHGDIHYGEGHGGIHNGEGHGGIHNEDGQVVLLNGNLYPEEEDDVPLLNRLDLSDDESNDEYPHIIFRAVPYQIEAEYPDPQDY